MLKRIAIVGPESTGKTTLAEQLAKHYKTLWVPEYAREYLDSINRPYVFDDLLTIARFQLEEEDRKAALAQKFLICDTNLVVIKVWGEFKYGKSHPWIDEQLKVRQYALHLLMDIDFPWIADPQREHPEHRKELFALYVDVVRSLGQTYEIIGGKPKARLEKAVELIDGIG